MNLNALTDEQRLEARKDRLKTIFKINSLPFDRLTKQALDSILDDQKARHEAARGN